MLEVGWCGASWLVDIKYNWLCGDWSHCRTGVWQPSVRRQWRPQSLQPWSSLRRWAETCRVLHDPVSPDVAVRWDTSRSSSSDWRGSHDSERILLTVSQLQVNREVPNDSSDNPVLRWPEQERGNEGLRRDSTTTSREVLLWPGSSGQELRGRPQLRLHAGEVLLQQRAVAKLHQLPDGLEHWVRGLSGQRQAPPGHHLHSSPQQVQHQDGHWTDQWGDVGDQGGQGGHPRHGYRGEHLRRLVEQVAAVRRAAGLPEEGFLHQLQQRYVSRQEWLGVSGTLELPGVSALSEGCISRDLWILRRSGSVFQAEQSPEKIPSDEREDREVLQGETEKIGFVQIWLQVISPLRRLQLRGVRGSLQSNWSIQEFAWPAAGSLHTPPGTASTGRTLRAGPQQGEVRAGPPRQSDGRGGGGGGEEVPVLHQERLKPGDHRQGDLPLALHHQHQVPGLPLPLHQPTLPQLAQTILLGLYPKDWSKPSRGPNFSESELYSIHTGDVFHKKFLLIEGWC